MSDGALQTRLARLDELGALTALMDLAIGELLKPFLTEAELASSRTIMGLDSQVIRDGTYFVVEENGALAGCGGWSRRATAQGRPVGVVLDRTGALLAADDVGNVIWRVVPGAN